jgi:NDP-sugar pyrophosphorylase family protein
VKERITITLDSELIKQIDKRIDGRIIKNRSQQIEILLTKSLGTYRPEKAVVLAGKKSDKTIPSCMLKIQDKTVAEHIFDLLKKYGIREVIMIVCHLKEKVMDYFEDGAKLGVSITYIEESEELGTGGALRLAKEQLNDSFILTNGDELKNLNIPRMFRLHKRKNALATVALTTVGNPKDYGVASLSGSRILDFREKPTDEETSNLINAGFYILEPKIVDLIPKGHSSLERDVFPKLAKTGKLRGFPIAGQWFDVTDSQRYEVAKKKWLGVNPHGEYAS